MHYTAHIESTYHRNYYLELRPAEGTYAAGSEGTYTGPSEGLR